MKEGLERPAKSGGDIQANLQGVGRKIFLADDKKGRATGPVPAPKMLPAFPDAQPANPKTGVQGGGGKLRKRWKDSQGNIYEWDSQHGTVEKYNKRGKHLAEFDANTGAQTKPADKTRSVEP